MKTPKEQLLAWLGDAHAMEKGVAETLKRHAHETGDAVAMRAFIEDHVAVTNQHAEKLKQCLERLGHVPQTLAGGITRFSGLFASLTTTYADDILLRNTLTEYAIEHFEIACYTSLITAASALGEEEIAITCESILEDERAMAEALEGQLEEMTVVYLEKLGAQPR